MSINSNTITHSSEEPRLDGLALEWFESVDSVMAKARTWLSSPQISKDDDLYRCFASRVQTAGVGQRGRSWESLDGNLHIAIAIKKGKLKVQIIHLLPHLISVAVCSWMEKRFSIRPTIKWPNDILLNGCKVAGILCEGSISGQIYGDVIIGIGVNLRHHPLVTGASYRASSLLQTQKIESDALQESKSLFEQVKVALSEYLEQPDALIQAYRAYATRPGHVWDSLTEDQVIVESLTQSDFLRDGQLRLRAGKDETILSSSSDLKVSPRATSENFHLVADVGNSRIKLGLLRLNPNLRFEIGGASTKELLKPAPATPFWDLLTEITLPVSHETELFEKARNWIQTAGRSRSDTLKKFSTLSSVVVSDQNEQILMRWCVSQGIHYRRLSKRPIRLVRSHYQLDQIGDDRFFALEGALAISVHQNIQGAFMVVSLGTATTLDFIDKDRVHLGGQIGIGANTGLAALSDHTSRLPKLSLDADSMKGAIKSSGVNTKEAMTTAAVSMQCHWILGERNSFAAKQGVSSEEISLILSGGLSQEMESQLLRLDGEERRSNSHRGSSRNILNVPNLVQLGALLGVLSQ